MHSIEVYFSAKDEKKNDQKELRITVPRKKVKDNDDKPNESFD
jgi:hypothetical protein